MHLCVSVLWPRFLVIGNTQNFEMLNTSWGSTAQRFVDDRSQFIGLDAPIGVFILLLIACIFLFRCMGVSSHTCPLLPLDIAILMKTICTTVFRHSLSPDKKRRWEFKTYSTIFNTYFFFSSINANRYFDILFLMLFIVKRCVHSFFLLSFSAGQQWHLISKPLKQRTIRPPKNTLIIRQYWQKIT